MLRSRMSRTEKVLICSVVLAFFVLLAATVCTVILNSAASGTLYTDPPFALSSLISDVENILDEVVFIQNGHIRMVDSVENIRFNQGKSVDTLFREVFKC